MVYNNFEIVHVPRFQASDVAAFNAAVDATMRIYSHRCEQDVAPQRSVAVMVVVHVPDINDITR